MIKILDYQDMTAAEILNRSLNEDKGVEAIVHEIIAAIAEQGDQALRHYSRQFDGADLDEIEVSQTERTDAFSNTDPQFIKTLEGSAANIKKFHQHQLHQGFRIEDTPGIILGQKYTAMERVGIYVPGGTASYPSSVLMNAIPARIAGVKEIIMVTPPDASGKVAEQILAAAQVAGVDRIFKIGGAQAVAALAYGTESVPKVDKIVGPGNIFVATAKRCVFGLVDIDMIAGPSEILVIADHSATPAHIAADLLSQAEHDKLAAAVMVCCDRALAQAVQAEVEIQLPTLKRAEFARDVIDYNSKIIIADNLEQAVSISNQIAPEHLELCVEEPFALLELVQNAGSIFLGHNAPEALGDYYAGPNHTLPTGGTARFSSPLSVDDFVKKSSYVYYDHQALAAIKDRVIDFATREGLEAHARSVAIRFTEEGGPHE